MKCIEAGKLNARINQGWGGGVSLISVRRTNVEKFFFFFFFMIALHEEEEEKEGGKEKEGK